jgi:ABC-type transport system involved in multi-copper enzyme maturation permease subunit
LNNSDSYLFLQLELKMAIFKEKKIINDALIIAGFDITTSLRNMRAFLSTIIYSLGALGLGFVMVEIEQKLRIDPNSIAIGIKDKSADLTTKLKALITLFLKMSPDFIDYLLNIPLIAIVFFWFSITFLPLFLAFTTHDQISGEFQHNSIRYTVLRTCRSSFILGKILGQFILFLGITLIANTVIFGYASMRMDYFDEIKGMKYFALFFFFTAVMGLAYLALMTFLSTIPRSPNISLLLCIAVLIVSGILSRFDYVKWISLSAYKNYLWSNEFLEVAFSLIVYVVFASVFGFLAYLNLRRKDL